MDFGAVELLHLGEALKKKPETKVFPNAFVAKDPA